MSTQPPTDHPPTTPLEPVEPSTDVRAELLNIINNDQSRLGEIHRMLERGLSANEIQAELGLQHNRFVWNYQRIIKALLDGNLPGAPTVAHAVAQRFRSLLWEHTFSPETDRVLRHNLAVLETRASDRSNQNRETQQALDATNRVEAEGIPGIYVYTLPHYLHHPYDPETGRTLYKVGRSDRDVIERFRTQTRITALPEEPVLLRIYRTDETDASATIERQFHLTLEAADHDRSTARTGGTEWFLTSLKFLDQIAGLLNIPIETILDDGDTD